LKGLTKPYDLFISYSLRDHERGLVAALKAQIESSFCAFAGRDLRVFFDTHEIAGMDDWRQKIQRRESFDLRPWHDVGKQALQQARVPSFTPPSASDWIVPPLRVCGIPQFPQTTSTNTTHLQRSRGISVDQKASQRRAFQQLPRSIDKFGTNFQMATLRPKLTKSQFV
jgi:hypothetical protein